MKNLIDYLWNCSAGEAVFYIIVGALIASWVVEMFVDSFKK